ncbi:MAG: hypothetical protein JSS68_18795 [Actinobacteria bacterium]|nr:hypothetical protein [Actinomycetota bacterium]
MNSARRTALIALLGALALLLLAAGQAAATTHKPLRSLRPPAKVTVGRVAVGRTPYLGGQFSLLVAVSYPIQASGRVMKGRVEIRLGRQLVFENIFFGRVSAGALRRPERRRRFTFVHQIHLSPATGELLERARREGRVPVAEVEADGRIDVDHDGIAELTSHATARRLLRGSTPAVGRSASGAEAPGQAFCGDFPVTIVPPNSEASIPLPACTAPVKWKVTGRPAGVSVGFDHRSLEFKTGPTEGAATIQLNHGTAALRIVGGTPGKTLVGVGPAQPVVRAMGDSVTAGFGYYADGTLMPFLSLYECKPVGQVLDDACSSNSTATASGLKEVPYAADYGLSNNVSWAAQWANKYGVTNYKNYAVSGSEPTNWAPGGNLYATTQKIESENPDYILMTIGANPILANTLFGLGSMRCALESDLFGGYQKCVEESFEEVHLRAELKRLYANLVEKTQATIYLMQYHLAIPSSALAYSVTQIAEMGKLMNETIAAVAAEVNAATKSTRLQVISPPHFNVGVSLEPVYPSSYTCSYFEYGVDGPSVQATPTQDELEASHYLSFCGGPKGGGEPWVISGDTGIHPSAAGYAQMAAQVPPPAPQG